MSEQICLNFLLEIFWIGIRGVWQLYMGSRKSAALHDLYERLPK